MRRYGWLLLLSACAANDVIVYGNREPAELQPVVEGEGIFHTVGPGETAFRIAKAYGIALDDLLGQNDITDPKKLKVGDVLFVSGATAVVKVETAPAKTPDAPLDKDEAEERAAVLSRLGKLEWPVDGIVTTRFGIRGSRRHDGIDISAPEGTKVQAAGQGVVLYAGDGQRGYGNLIIIKHAENLVTLYAHNKQNLVKEGDRVERGQHIAHVGQTGRAEGPHLHFEVRQRDKPKNPLFYLP
jgi:murein DD-endopeptidase MepM/ murein hydrolase activator NlpD